MTDWALREAIRSQLLADHQLSSHAVHVEAHQGVVTLHGTVPNWRLKLAAQELAATTSGCRDVVNELTVDPAGGISDEEVAERVRLALELETGIHKAAITVQVHCGTVLLRGAVATPAEYVKVEDVAAGVHGVRRAQNELIIDRDAQVEDEALQEEIQAALSVRPGLSRVRVAVSGNLIVLSGHVQDNRHRKAATEVAQSIRPWRIQNEITAPSA